MFGNRETVILKRDCDAVMIPAGTKKLVPPIRSNINRMPAPSNTGNASKPRIDVISSDHCVNGSRIIDNPFVRIVRIVVM